MDEKKIIEKLNKVHTEFKRANDAAQEQRETIGQENGETRALVVTLTEEVQNAMTELKEIRAQVKMVKTQEPADEAAEMQRRAFVNYARLGFEGAMAISETPEEKRALTQASDSSGAFFVPDDMESDIIMNAHEIAVIGPLCNTGTTGRSTVVGSILARPTIAWGRENLDITEQELTGGRNEMKIHDLKALHLISNDTLDDAEADIVGELNGGFGRAIAEAEDFSYAAGLGTNQPEGITVWADIQANYTPTGVAAAIQNASNNGMDALITLMMALKGTYRAGAVWLMNSTTIGLYMQLKDGEGRYLWQPMTQEGQPSSLLGKPVHPAEGMPDVAANSYPVAFADLKLGYKIRYRSGITIQRLDERYAEKDQVGFKIKRRVGGQPVLAEAFQLMKVATT